jgi:hypothetical protein
MQEIELHVTGENNSRSETAKVAGRKKWYEYCKPDDSF